MKKTIIRLGIAIVLVAAATLVVPVNVGSVSTVDTACAALGGPTGTCKWSPPDICFVDGNAYYDREWISGEPN